MHTKPHILQNMIQILIFWRRYLPIGGLKKFNDLSIRLAYGEEIVSSHPIAALQSLSGTGSLRLWAAFMHRFMPGAEIFIPSITWYAENHTA